MLKNKMLVWLVILFLFSGLLMVFIPGVGATYDYQYTDGDGVVWSVKAITSGSGNWEVPSFVEKIDILVVAGGGGSGRGTFSINRNAGGGGAGGLVWVRNVTRIGTTDIVGGNTISYSVGASGAGGTSASAKGGTGGDTVFGNLTAKGGGGGGSGMSPDASNGGSGGGAGSYDGSPGIAGTSTQSAQAGWSGIYGSGNGGGTGTSGGGGGGASGAGSGTTGGTGMDMSSYFGTTYGNSGVFSSGGGANDQGVHAISNSGMGGRAQDKYIDAVGRAGGSGIVLIRWRETTVSVIDTYPSTGLDGVSKDISQINATIVCSKGNSFNWSIATIPNVGSNNSTGSTNGTFFASVSGLANGTTYLVYVNTTDSNGVNDSYVFNFTTFGFIEFWCFDENNIDVSLSFSLEITNHLTYTDTTVNTGDRISIDDLPYGDEVTFAVTSIGYKSRLYTYSINPSVLYNFSFYLPKDIDPGQLYSNSKSVSNPAVDLVITLDEIPQRVILVQAWNGSTYGHWYDIPDDKYSLSGKNVTVDSSMLDSNTATVKVHYYPPGVSEYIFTVVDLFNVPVQNARVDVQRLFNNTYKSVTSHLTDPQGYLSAYLVPGASYRIVVSKTGYINSTIIYIPSSHTFTRTLSIQPDYDLTDYDDFSITVTSYRDNSTDRIYITYTDTASKTTDWSIYTYSIYNGVWTLIDSTSKTLHTNTYYISGVNTSRFHIHVLYYNNTQNFMPSYDPPLYYDLYPVTIYISRPKIDIEDRFTSIFGEGPMTGFWTAVISITLAMIAFLSLGPFNVPLSCIAGGLSLGFTQIFFEIYFTNNFEPLLLLVAGLAVFFGIMLWLTKKSGEVDL